MCKFKNKHDTFANKYKIGDIISVPGRHLFQHKRHCLKTLISN